MTLQLCFRMFYLITKVLMNIAQSRIAVSASFMLSIWGSFRNFRTRKNYNSAINSKQPAGYHLRQRTSAYDLLVAFWVCKCSWPFESKLKPWFVSLMVARDVILDWFYYTWYQQRESRNHRRQQNTNILVYLTRNLPISSNNNPVRNNDVQKICRLKEQKIYFNRNL